MDFDFTKVSFDTDLDDIDDVDELRGIVRKFEDAQDNNISEFAEAKDTLDELEGRVGEAEEFKRDLAESLSEVSPLSEEEAMTYDMARIRELIAEFSVEEDESEGDAETEEGSFSNMGERGETHGDDEEAHAFAERHLGDIEGLSF